MAGELKPKRELPEHVLRNLALGRAKRDANRQARARGEPVEPRATNGSSGIATVDPAAIDASRNGSSDSGPGRGGGGDGGADPGGSWSLNWFKRGSGTDKRKSASRKTATVDLSGIEGLLHSCFIVLSFRAGSHWAIDEQEAKALSDAIARVVRHYPVASTQKAADWGQLAIVAATIGGPRALQSWQQAPTTRRSTPTPRPSSPQPATGPMPAPVVQNVQTPSQLDPVSMAGSHATAGTA